MWKTITYRLTSSCPLIQHNGQTADPLNRYSKALKQVSSKRAKTDADHEEMARIEFMAGLYFGQDGPVIPASNLAAMLIAAAKKSKEGTMAKSAILCAEHAPLEYDGPRTAEELFASDAHRFSAIVRVGTARVARMRPIFPKWTATVNIQLDTAQANVARLDEWMRVGGVLIGLGDWRPQYGRFSCERID